MNKLVVWFVLIAVAVIAVVGAYWALDLRWRPRTITKNQAEIVALLEQSGWVSPGLDGPRLYMVGFRDCPGCAAFKKDALPKLVEAGVETRVIEFARRDRNGLEQSTAAERATVAELWINRSWTLMQRWDASPVEAWTAQGLPPADGDMARTAVVNAGRDMVDKLEPLLKANGVSAGTPILVWWSKDGVMHGCSCGSEAGYRHALKDFGAK